MFKVSPASLQGQGDTRLTLTPSAVPNFNCVIMVKLLKYACFLYCNYQVNRDFLITVYFRPGMHISVSLIILGHVSRIKEIGQSVVRNND
jgi:hypothetical protein